MNQLMNKIGYWLERNMDKFYADDPERTDDDNHYLKRKAYDKIWMQAEAMI